MPTDKEWFESNTDKIQELLVQREIDSKQDFEDYQEELFKMLRAKPILNGVELMKLRSSPDNYIVEKMVWQGDIVILLASEKVGKSVFALQMACALTCGDYFMQEYEVPGAKKILYIQAEGTREETKTRIEQMTSKGGIRWDAKNFYHMFPASLALDTEEGFNDIVSKIYNTDFHPEVIFIDPLYMAMEGDLIDNKRSRIFCRNMRRLKEMFNCTIIIVHHKRRPQTNYKGVGIKLNKQDDTIMGSFVWKAFPSHIINLVKLKNNIRKLTCETQRGSVTIRDMELEMIEPMPLMFVVNGSLDCMPYVDRVLNYLAGCKEPQSADMATKGTGLSESAVRKSYRRLLETNKIMKVNEGHTPTLYAVRRDK